MGCGNSTYGVERWKRQHCEEHDCGMGSGGCACAPPFKLYPFPTRTNPDGRRRWIKLINRKEPNGKNWEPKYYDRVCSKHFVHGAPTAANPDPVLHLGYELSKVHSNTDFIAPKRKPPAARHTPPHTKQRKTEKQSLTNATSTSISHSTTADDIVNADLNTSAPGTDHAYSFDSYHCTCTPNCSCLGCAQKAAEINKLKFEREAFATELSVLKKKLKKTTKYGKHVITANAFLTTDSKVRLYTGLPNKSAFAHLFQHIQVKAKRMRYWRGKKTVVLSKMRNYKKSPRKPGPHHKISIKDQLFLTLAKLRLGLHTEFLADLFGISKSTCSNNFNSFMKLLVEELHPLIFWPSKEAIQEHMPQQLKCKYPQLRCTIDCT